MTEQTTGPEIRSTLLRHLPHVVRSAVEGDGHRALVSARRLFAALRELDPSLVEELNRATFGGTGASSPRSSSLRGEHDTTTTVAEPGPVTELLTIVTDVPNERPVLPPEVEHFVEELIAEQRAGEQLQRHGLRPRTTVLLLGPPGVGKTMLAKWIARALDVPLAQVDLAYLVSSYLGQTGQNLRAVLDYARSQRVVLLLDEFDAIAKRRDDVTDLGELKRVVSVLLKDLEDWLGPSLVVAASNHPELIDPAVFRRFSLSFKLGALDQSGARRVLVEHLRPEDASDEVLDLLGALLAGESGSNVRDLAHEARRRHVLGMTDSLDTALLELSARRATTTAQRRWFCRMARRLLPQGQTSVRKLGQLLGGAAPATVHQYLKSGGDDGGRTEVPGSGERTGLPVGDRAPRVGRRRTT